MKKNLFFKTSFALALAIAGTTQLYAVTTVSSSSSLQSAINNASSGETIQLAANIDAGTSGILISGKTLTLDLDGYTLTGSAQIGYGSNYSCLTVAGASNVTITGKEGSKIIGDVTTNSQTAALFLGSNTNKNASATITIKGDVDFEGYTGIEFYYDNTNKTLITDKTYSGTIEGSRYAIQFSAHNSSFISNGGNFKGGYYTIFTSYSNNKITINDGYFDATNYLFSKRDDATVIINGGTFTSTCAVDISYLADGCELTENADGTLIVQNVGTYYAYYNTAITTVKSSSGYYDDDHKYITTYTYQINDKSKKYITTKDIVLNDGAKAVTDFYSFVVPEDVSGVNITYTRTFSNNNWKAWYMPFDLDASAYSDKVTFYEITGINETDDGWNTTVSEVTGTVKANTPYVVKSKSSSSQDITFTVTNGTLYKTADNTQTFKTSGSTFTFTGTYTKKFTQIETGWYGLAGDGTFSKQTKQSASNFLYPFRFYLTIEGTAASKANIGGFNVVDDDDPTGISNVNVETQKDNVVYDLQGRRVNNPSKGIYIVNGKKVLVK